MLDMTSTPYEWVADMPGLTSVLSARARNYAPVTTPITHSSQLTAHPLQLTPYSSHPPTARVQPSSPSPNRVGVLSGDRDLR